MTDEAIPKLMAAVPEPVRPAVVDLLHLGYRAFGGVVDTAVPQLAAALGERAGVRHGTLARLQRRDRPAAPAASRSPPPHEVAMLAADHLLYGLVIGRLGGRPN